MAVQKWMKRAAVTIALLLIGAIFMYPEQPQQQELTPTSVPVTRVSQEPVPFFASAEEKEPDPEPAPIGPEPPNQIMSDVWTGPVFWDFQSLSFSCQCCQPEPSIMQIELGGFQNVNGKPNPTRGSRKHRIISPRPKPQRIDRDE